MWLVRSRSHILLHNALFDLTTNLEGINNTPKSLTKLVTAGSGSYIALNGSLTEYGTQLLSQQPCDSTIKLGLAGDGRLATSFIPNGSQLTKDARCMYQTASVSSIMKNQRDCCPTWHIQGIYTCRAWIRMVNAVGNVQRLRKGKTFRCCTILDTDDTWGKVFLS